MSLGKIDRGILCSVWDFLHHTWMKPMTITEIYNRFGCRKSTAEKIRDVAIAIGADVREVDTPGGVAYKTVSLDQGHRAVEREIERLDKERRKTRRSAAARRKSLA